MSAGAAGRYGRFLLLAALAATGLGAIGTPLTRSMAGDGGMPALIVALTLCWVAAAIGGLPLLAASRRREVAGGAAVQTAVQLTPALAAMGLRLGVVVTGAAAIALAGLVPTRSFLLWTGVGYLAMLVVETLYAVGEVRRLDRSEGPAAQPPGGAEARTGRQDAALEHHIGETETR